MTHPLGLVLHPTKPVGDSIDTIVAWAAGHDVEIVARADDRHRLPAAVTVVTDRAFTDSVRGVIALGGDGTMLGALRLLIDRPVPVLGVNHGNLGFLVEVTPRRLAPALDRLTAGDFTVESHGCLVTDGDVTPRYGFNDIVLGRASRSGAVSVDLTVGEHRYGYYRADAVVLSTAHGSTAYNYAAGGPVLSPSAAAVVVTPVAPMSGINRSVVLGAGDRITLSVADDSAPVGVDVDGIAAAELQPGDVLTAAYREDAGQVVRLAAGEHDSRSRIKLSLLDLPLRRDQLLELIPESLRHQN